MNKARPLLIALAVLATATMSAAQTATIKPQPRTTPPPSTKGSIGDRIAQQKRDAEAAEAAAEEERLRRLNADNAARIVRYVGACQLQQVRAERGLVLIQCRTLTITGTDRVLPDPRGGSGFVRGGMMFYVQRTPENEGLAQSVVTMASAAYLAGRPLIVHSSAIRNDQLDAASQRATGYSNAAPIERVQFLD